LSTGFDINLRLTSWDVMMDEGCKAVAQLITHSRPFPTDAKDCSLVPSVGLQ
jgi:hypothetical protein